MRTHPTRGRTVPGLAAGLLAAMLLASSASSFAQEHKKDHNANTGKGDGGGQAPAHNRSASPSGSPQGGSQSGGAPSHDASRGGASSEGSRNAGSGSQDSGRHFGQHDNNQNTRPADASRGTGPQDSGRHAGQHDSNQNTRPADTNRGAGSQDSGRQFGQHDSNQNTRPADVTRGTGSHDSRTFGQHDSNANTRPPDVNRGSGSHDTNRGPSPAFDNRGGRPTEHTGGFGTRGGGPRPEYRGANGSSARFDHSGRPMVVHTRDTTIMHVPGGVRRVEVVRPGGRVIVTNSAGFGYVQRPVVVRNTTFVQRNYYIHGVSYTRVYRPWVYGGFTFHVYTPVRYYSPRFYVWAYTPWRAPISYRWGWFGDPWYRSYSWYFTPYPVYHSPTLWLTDFLIAATLRDAYQERLDAQAAAQANYEASLYAGNQVAMSPQVKQMVADEVQRQLALERAEGERANQNMMPASGGAPPMLSGNNPHIFLVSSGLMTYANGQECALTHGDVLALSRTPSSDPSYANVQVMASKGQDCATGYVVPVQLADLQEMDNQMRAMIDQGLGDLQSHQGQSGLPPIEASMQTQTAAPYASELPPPEPNVSTELQQQAQEADRQEQQVLSQASSDQPAGGPPTITLGQSISEVEQLLGRPNKIVDLGPKKTYVYSDMKVVFTDGRVSDVQ